MTTNRILAAYDRIVQAWLSDGRRSGAELAAKAAADAEYRRRVSRSVSF
jgi:hypothetical protein